MDEYISPLKEQTASSERARERERGDEKDAGGGWGMGRFLGYIA